MDRSSLFEIIQSKYVHAVHKHYNSFRIIQSLKKNELNNFKVSQYTDYDKSCASSENGKKNSIKIPN